tara:strand:- start:40 stop:375 length:336 start_codon:yes stop_codon:yes gene_type:complete
MASVHEMIYMKMTNGEYIYGTNLDIGKYSVKHNCECEHEFDHVPPCKLEGQGGYSDGSKAFKYVGTEHDPMSASHGVAEQKEGVDAYGEKYLYKTNGWDYKTGELIDEEKW